MRLAQPFAFNVRRRVMKCILPLCNPCLLMLSMKRYLVCLAGYDRKVQGKKKRESEREKSLRSWVLYVIFWVKWSGSKQAQIRVKYAFVKCSTSKKV